MATQRQQLKKALGKKMEAMYNVDYEKDDCYVHKPAFINIYYDNDFSVESNETVVRIINSKAVVTLWRDNLIMHITIFE